MPLPLSTGIQTVTRNIGTMYNRGIEMELGLDIVRSKDFTWHLDVNGTHLKNKITKMPDENPVIIDGTKQLAVGTSIYDFWLREYRGISSETGEVLYKAASYVASNSRITETGDTLTTSANNAQYHYNGTSIPTVSGGFTNSFRFKGLYPVSVVRVSVGR